MPEFVLPYEPIVITSTENLPRDEWLAFRKTGIGGSEVAAVFGISPFGTARDVFYDKLNIASAFDDEANKYQKKIGSLLEDVVAEMFSEVTSYPVFKIQKMFRSREHYFMLADVDFFVRLPDGSFAILECKTTSPDATEKWWNGAEPTIPLNYQFQGRQYMSVIPIDGIVVTFNDIAYSKSCGRTGHHYKDGMAFKFADDYYETVLRSIEWTPSRTGEISPVAVFDMVEIDGCEVSRASLHNLSFIKGLELMPNCRILVSKRNMIIPQVEDNLDRGGFDAGSLFPKTCPCCGEPTRIHTSRTDKRTTETICCDNPYCETRRLRQFVHFVSKKAMDIEGLSEATLEKFIGRGWLHSFMDIYRLDEHQEEIVRMDGFGEKSWRRLWDAIQASRNTTFERYLIAMDIPMIGNTASRELCRAFNGSLASFEAAVDGGYDFTQLADFGDTLHQNIHNWFRDEENRYLWEELQMMMNIEKKETMTAIQQDSPFMGKTIVVTGKVEPYTRDGINAKIASLGAHPGSSVSKNTDYLVCGEKAGSKLQKAQTLGVTVLSPAQFFQMADE